ncbi:MFS transporter [Celerinatantimonas sp. MCCC 1A17872]|uniref:MFS transporter n=1 Tax=Celerinatantimonas sp. MCCC 1A17872 TaxID=3177514 RepID=UPI0038BF282B
MTARVRRLVYLVCAASIVAFANLYLFHPLLPVMAKHYHETELAANMIMAVAMAGMGVGLVVFAGLADAIGRRKIFLWSIFSGSVVTLLIPFMGQFSLIIAARFVQGFLLAGCPAVAIAFMSDELPVKRIPMAVGMFVAANSLGGLSGRLSSAFLTQLSGYWQVACWVLGAIGIIVMVIAMFTMPQAQGFSAKQFSLKQMVRDFSGHLLNRHLVAIYIVAGIAFGTFVNQFSLLLFVLDKPPYSLPTAMSGLIFLCYLAGTFAAARSGKFSQKFGLVRGMQTGLILMMVGSLILLAHSLVLVLVGLCFLAAGFFFCHSQASSLVGRQVTHAKASAQALYTLFYYFGASIGAFYLQPFYDWLGWSGVVLALFIAIGICLLITLNLTAARSRGNLHDIVMNRSH